MFDPFKIAREIAKISEEKNGKPYVVTEYLTGGRKSAYVRKQHFSKSDWVIRVSDHKPHMNKEDRRNHFNVIVNSPDFPLQKIVALAYLKR